MMSQKIVLLRQMLLAAILVLPLVLSAPAEVQAQVTAEVTDEGVEVYVGGDLFTVYRYGPELKYPYFYPLNGPVTGQSVTTESTEPFPHHSSLFFACDRVNGGNYWQEGLDRGQIDSQTIYLLPEEGESITFHNRCGWVRPGAPIPFIDHRTVTISAPTDTLRVIDFTIMLEAQIDVTIRKTNHALFSARVVPSLSVEEGGVMVNSNGQEGEEATFGKEAGWMDYGGMRDGVFEGIAIFDHPENRWHPSPWFTRNYGFFSPTPMNWLENDQMTLAEGETLTLRYRVVVHSGNHEEAGLAQLYEEWASSQP